jgi:phosphohistidine phosphatase
MKLYFIRHTTAVDFASSDAERELTKEGREEARVAGRALVKLGVKPDFILTSPLTRARQTAAGIAEELKFSEELTTCDELCNEATPAQLLHAVKGLPGAKEVLLVGHMPSLAVHLDAFLGAENPTGLSFGKGTVACIEITDLRSGHGQLRWFLHQKQLRLLA